MTGIYTLVKTSVKGTTDACPCSGGDLVWEGPYVTGTTVVAAFSQKDRQVLTLTINSCYYGGRMDTGSEMTSPRCPSNPNPLLSPRSDNASWFIRFGLEACDDGWFAFHYNMRGTGHRLLLKRVSVSTFDNTKCMFYDCSQVFDEYWIGGRLRL